VVDSEPHHCDGFGAASLRWIRSRIIVVDSEPYYQCSTGFLSGTDLAIYTEIFAYPIIKYINKKGEVIIQ
jgi:hypothetical protein